MEFLELKYRLLSLLVLAESKLKSWIIKYGRRESVELLLQNYIVSWGCILLFIIIFKLYSRLLGINKKTETEKDLTVINFMTAFLWSIFSEVNLSSPWRTLVKRLKINIIIFVPPLQKQK